MTIRRAERARDLAVARGLLRAAGLPLAGVADHFDTFLVARAEDGTLCGVIGVELYGRSGLLRSLAVSSDRQNAGIGKQLVTRLLEFAATRGVTDLYLLTDTAADYFRRFGFEPISRDAVPAAVKTSAEFADAVCAGAVAMHRTL